jgi:hypothetical protein
MSNWEQLAGGSKSVLAGAARASTLPLVKALLDEPAAIGGVTLLALVLLNLRMSGQQTCYPAYSWVR